MGSILVGLVVVIFGNMVLNIVFQYPRFQIDDAVRVALSIIAVALALQAFKRSEYFRLKERNESQPEPNPPTSFKRPGA